MCAGCMPVRISAAGCSSCPQQGPGIREHRLRQARRGSLVRSRGLSCCACLMRFEVAENEPALEFVAANDAADEQVVRSFVTSAGRLARKRAGLRKDEFVRLDQPLQLLDGC